MINLHQSHFLLSAHMAAAQVTITITKLGSLQKGAPHLYSRKTAKSLSTGLVGDGEVTGLGADDL